MKRLTQREVEERIDTMTNGEYSVASQYINSTSVLDIRHNSEQCDHFILLTSWKKFTQDNVRCPFCSKGKPFSINEKIIFYHIKSIFPDADPNKKVELNGRKRDCDIYFELMSIREKIEEVVVQYDSLIYHSDPKKDDEFDDCFKDTGYIIRFREKGCPYLKEMNNLFIIDYLRRIRNKKSFVDKYVKQIEGIIKKIASITVCIEFNPELVKSAILDCTSLDDIVNAVNNYSQFCYDNGRTPQRKAEDIVERRIADKLDQFQMADILTDIQKEEIWKAQLKYGRGRMTPEYVLNEWIRLVEINKRLPQEKSENNAGKNENEKYENSIAERLRSNIYKKMYSKNQMDIINQTKKRYAKWLVYSEPEIIVQHMVEFIKLKKSLPSMQSENDDERRLAQAVVSLKARQKFTSDQIEIINHAKATIGKLLICETPEELRIRYEKFFKENGYKAKNNSLPGSYEKKLAWKVCDFKSRGMFNSEQVKRIKYIKNFKEILL